MKRPPKIPNPRSLHYKKPNECWKDSPVMPKIQPIFVTQSQLPSYRKKQCPKQCPILGHTPFQPVVDHDHKTGRIRGVISSEGNALIGKIENFHRSRCVNGVYDLPTVLRAIADYIEQSAGGPYHPRGLRQLARRFMASKRKQQIETLLSFGIPASEVKECRNSKQRAKLYRRVLT